MEEVKNQLKLVNSNITTMKVPVNNAHKSDMVSLTKENKFMYE